MQVHYEVKWKGFDRTQSTWEPIGHLVGAEALIKELEVRLEKENVAFQERARKAVEERREKSVKAMLEREKLLVEDEDANKNS